MDGAGHHGERGGLYGCGASPSLSRPKYHRGTWVSLDQESRGLAPVWLEKPERIAALAMLTVLGLLVSSVIQRQVRLYLRTHDQQLPGNKGLTATPTAAVVLALFAQVALVQLWIDEQEVMQLSGSNLITCWSVTLWASTPRGMQCPQPENTAGTFRPLERGS